MEKKNAEQSEINLAMQRIVVRALRVAMKRGWKNNAFSALPMSTGSCVISSLTQGARVYGESDIDRGRCSEPGDRPKSERSGRRQQQAIFGRRGRRVRRELSYISIPIPTL